MGRSATGQFADCCQDGLYSVQPNQGDDDALCGRNGLDRVTEAPKLETATERMSSDACLAPADRSSADRTGNSGSALIARWRHSLAPSAGLSIALGYRSSHRGSR